ncbi:MAG: hypothetical protein JNM76_14690 [Betaproteobacteria bacterium]|nr:hypothetical protein [Betaproteobacteria bacterium]
MSSPGVRPVKPPPVADSLRRQVWDVLPVWTPETAATVVGFTRQQIVEATGLSPTQVSAVMKRLIAAGVLKETGERKKPALWARTAVEIPDRGRGRPRGKSSPRKMAEGSQPIKSRAARPVTPPTGALNRSGLLSMVFAPLIGKRHDD